MELYKKYRHFGWNGIPDVECVSDIYTDDELCLLYEVWDVYGKEDRMFLKNFVQTEAPWLKAVRNKHGERIINEYDMTKYYGSLVNKIIEVD
ncbi:hypothetical protein PBN151_1409 [Paenibacillus sp. NAIST15-1]|nr:hypothetical protein PBN151_1409 [Paenibacillus sp. NAIST15-1]